MRFTTLADELQEAESRRELARVVGRYARTELVVLDELGYLALAEGAAELVFQVISERNERGSLIITTNLPFGEWTKVFPDPRLAKAVVDRAHRPENAADARRQVATFPLEICNIWKRRTFRASPAACPVPDAFGTSRSPETLRACHGCACPFERLMAARGSAGNRATVSNRRCRSRVEPVARFGDRGWPEERQS